MRLIERQKKRFDKGTRLLAERRSSWDSLSDRAIKYLEALKEECREQELFENVYVVDSRTLEQTKHMLPHITVYFGNHPVGYSTFKNAGELAIEDGCALTISQDVFGHVGCIFYPFSSQLASMKNDHLVTAIYKSPDKIKDRHLRKFVRQLFSYAQLSSVHGCPTLVDHLRYQLMRVKHLWRNGAIKKFFKKVVLSVAGTALKSVIKAGT